MSGWLLGLEDQRENERKDDAENQTNATSKQEVVGQFSLKRRISPCRATENVHRDLHAEIGGAGNDTNDNAHDACDNSENRI